MFAAAVPVAAVDDLVRADYVEQRLSHATLYLLNPAAPRKLAHESEEHAQLLQAAGHARDGGGPLPTWCCLLYTSPSPRDATLSRMPSSA